MNKLFDKRGTGCRRFVDNTPTCVDEHINRTHRTAYARILSHSVVADGIRNGKLHTHAKDALVLHAGNAIGHDVRRTEYKTEDWVVA